ncbi:hypothetical protein A3K93_09305 [Acinetobacter sp. NCu2D-2]|uniref:hypothetical protein n=1 Tax=Acinetobacter sp. NCu2D-2 TaxID=1608473 RepID=UPI0007CDBAE3|nr:hypothetical protein [Acinetobacter sp. NCu2D-2]ANF82369.1 hypothetical protein A3K93_09305 [Acinetobacter sp. NCu2D-2]
MSLDFLHKPNYFMFAQLFIHHLERYIDKNPDSSSATFELDQIHALFQEDKASASTNLDGILNIADEYKVDSLEGDQKLIQQYRIDAKHNTLWVEFNSHALAGLKAGNRLIPPNAEIQE